MSQTRVAGGLCALILVIFTIAGLSPFRQIRNDVSWMADRPGVRFGKHGIILSDGSLPARGSGACSIEMWVRPAAGENSSTLLAFFGPDGDVGVSLHRSLTDLRLDRETGGRPIKWYADEILYDGRLAFLTVVSRSSGTTVYRDGVAIREIPQLRAATNDCSGGLGVGHSSRGHSSWQGDIHGLAIYGFPLTPEQVRENFQSWQTSGRPDDRNVAKPEVLYLFQERGGTRVNDSGRSGMSLTIPDHYLNIQRTWLQSPLSAFEPEWGYAEDVLINIGGFLPFGFMLSAFMASIRRVRRVVTWTVIGGVLVSLTIELLQVYLPTRNSDLTDVLTNTVGTCLGAAIYLSWQRRLLIQDDPSKSLNSWNLD
ncbi:MAG TPA: VanZ family protein [Nitrospiraceae bacterium]|nr:VanZ family protein [Nitrospiraceae bacterium]